MYTRGVAMGAFSSCPNVEESYTPPPPLLPLQNLARRQGVPFVKENKTTTNSNPTQVKLVFFLSIIILKLIIIMLIHTLATFYINNIIIES